MEEKNLQKYKISLGMWNCKYDARIFVVLNIIDKNFNMNIYDIRSDLCQSVRLSSIYLLVGTIWVPHDLINFNYIILICQYKI